MFNIRHISSSIIFMPMHLKLSMHLSTLLDWNQIALHPVGAHRRCVTSSASHCYVGQC